MQKKINNLLMQKLFNFLLKKKRRLKRKSVTLLLRHIAIPSEFVKHFQSIAFLEKNDSTEVHKSTAKMNK